LKQFYRSEKIMRKYIFYGLTLSIAWIFVTGSPTLATFIQGILFSIPITYVFRRFYPGNLKLIKLEKLPYLVEYLAFFLEALVASNLEVAQRLLRPSKEIQPEIIEYESTLENPTALAVLADSITLTPGTLTVDHEEETNTLLIHCLNGKCTDQTKKDIRKWENLLMKTFG